MIATKAAAERLMEIAFDFQRILLDYVHHEPETAAPSGESVKERYTRQEAEALADEIQRLSHFFELRTKRGRADVKAKAVKFRREPILTPHQMAEAIKRRDRDREPLRSIAKSYNVRVATISELAAWMLPHFIPADTREEAEEEAPSWAECYVPVAF